MCLHLFLRLEVSYHQTTQDWTAQSTEALVVGLFLLDLHLDTLKNKVILLLFSRLYELLSIFVHDLPSRVVCRNDLLG